MGSDFRSGALPFPFSRHSISFSLFPIPPVFGPFFPVPREKRFSLNAFSSNFQKNAALNFLGKSRKNWLKISKIQKNSGKICKKKVKISNITTILNETIEIRERCCFGQVLFSPVFDYGFQKRCKGVHCVDLGESFPTSILIIYLQNLASIQPRTSPMIS